MTPTTFAWVDEPNQPVSHTTHTQYRLSAVITVEVPETVLDFEDLTGSPEGDEGAPDPQDLAAIMEEAFHRDGALQTVLDYYRPRISYRFQLDPL